MKEKFDDKNLDALFKDKFSGEEIAPRELVWTKINKQLDEKDRRPLAWIWWLSGLILVGGISLFMLFGTNKENKFADHSADTAKENTVEKKNSAQNNAEKNKTTLAAKDSAYEFAETNDNPDYQYESGTSVNKNSENKNGANQKSTTTSSDQQKQNNLSGSNQKNKIISQSVSEKNNSIVSDITNSSKNNSHTNNSSEKNRNKKPAESFSANDKTKNSPALTSSIKTNSVNGNSADKNSLTTNPANIALSDPENVFAVNQDSLFSPKSEVITSLNRTTHFELIPSIMEYYPRVELDSAKLVASDSSEKVQPIFDPAPAPFVFPRYFVGIHGAIDESKILQSEINDDDYDNTDVAVYDKTKLKSAPQQTYSYGARFGWFLNKKISLTGGAYYSIFQSSENEGNFRYNHNRSYNFSMHSPTSTVQCESSNFNMYDCYHINFDTCYVDIKSQERYDYLNLQLGISFYAIRMKHFGLYANILSNGAILAKQQMSLIVPVSGKSFAFSGNQMTGMSKFVIGGQTGLGFEYLPFGNLGLWVEPSFYFSGSLNRKNSVNLQPGGVRFLFGVVYHF